MVEGGVNQTEPNQTDDEMRKEYFEFVHWRQIIKNEERNDERTEKEKK